MADATIKAWRCDLCGKVRQQGWYGYETYYNLDISCTSGEDIHGLSTHYPQICFECAEKIVDHIMELDDRIV